jgi:predicted dehydrogenase
MFLTSGGDPPVNPHTQVVRFDPADQYTIQAESFARAILDGEPVPLPPDDSVANMRVIDRIFEIGEV